MPTFDDDTCMAYIHLQARAETPLIWYVTSGNIPSQAAPHEREELGMRYREGGKEETDHNVRCVQYQKECLPKDGLG